jgi:hypothetical protein
VAVGFPMKTQKGQLNDGLGLIFPVTRVRCIEIETSSEVLLKWLITRTHILRHDKEESLCLR